MTLIWLMWYQRWAWKKSTITEFCSIIWSLTGCCSRSRIIVLEITSIPIMLAVVIGFLSIVVWTSWSVFHWTGKQCCVQSCWITLNLRTWSWMCLIETQSSNSGSSMCVVCSKQNICIIIPKCFYEELLNSLEPHRVERTCSFTTEWVFSSRDSQLTSVLWLDIHMAWMDFLNQCVMNMFTIFPFHTMDMEYQSTLQIHSSCVWIITNWVVWTTRGLLFNTYHIKNPVWRRGTISHVCINTSMVNLLLNTCQWLCLTENTTLSW